MKSVAETKTLSSKIRIIRSKWEFVEVLTSEMKSSALILFALGFAGTLFVGLIKGFLPNKILLVALFGGALPVLALLIFSIFGAMMASTILYSPVVWSDEDEENIRRFQSEHPDNAFFSESTRHSVIDSSEDEGSD